MHPISLEGKGMQSCRVSEWGKFAKRNEAEKLKGFSGLGSIQCSISPNISSVKCPSDKAGPTWRAHCFLSDTGYSMGPIGTRFCDTAFWLHLSIGASSRNLGFASLRDSCIYTQCNNTDTL